MEIREVSIEDAGNLLDLIKEVENQSSFMLMEAGERKTTATQQKDFLERMNQQDNSTIFVAEINSELIGYLIAIGGSVQRTKHSAYIVVGVLENYRGKGIGTELFDSLIKWASKHNISRLELTTVTENKAGLALYKRNGFEIEGTKRNSLIIDGKFYDEYYMSKILKRG